MKTGPLKIGGLKIGPLKVGPVAMSRRGLVAGAAVLVVAVGLALWAIRPGGSGSPAVAPSPCPTQTSLLSRPTASAAAGGGGVRVVDQGFSQLDGDGLVVSIGAVVENTGTEVAYLTPIHFRVFDADHASAIPASSGELLTQVIPVILPGERVGAGAWSYLVTLPTGRVVAAASIEVQLGSPQWWPVDGPDFRFASVTAVHRRTTFGDNTSRVGGVDYTTTSAYCADLADRGVATVFRDGSGAIIGGNLSWPHQRGCRAGKFDTSASVVTGIPDGLDDTKTTNHPYCDPVPHRPDPASTDQPAN